MSKYKDLLFTIGLIFVTLTPITKYACHQHDNWHHPPG